MIQSIATDIPARLDRLLWSRWHTRVVVALGITWLLDGLEGGVGGSLSGALKDAGTLHFTDAQLGLSSTVYLAGTVLGALLFGHLADRFGRRRLFFWTLILYVVSTAATGLSWNLLTFSLCRGLTGAGIGGEYTAINSAIDELIPARLRGRVDLIVNSTFWLGVMLGSFVSVALLSPSAFGLRLGWRIAFLSGLPIAALVLLLRRSIPESPRWLLCSGRLAEAERITSDIELAAGQGTATGQGKAARIDLPLRVNRSLRDITRAFRGRYRARALLCLGLMTAQSFFYNSVFFSMTLVLLRFYGMAASRVGFVFLPIAFANFLGPALLSRLFDTVGRRVMIAATFCVSGILLLVASWLFFTAQLTVFSQIAWWSVTFFFAASAAGSAYLTVGEVFPQEIRASSIACFYAFGTFAGGVFGPLIFGHLIGNGSRAPLFVGYAFAAVGMVAAGIAQALWGVSAEGRTLEELAPPEQIAATLV